MTGTGFPKRLTTEGAKDIEDRGFDLANVQELIDRLSRREAIGDQVGAAMLRGAFNDLLGRIDDLEKQASTMEQAHLHSNGDHSGTST